MPEIREHALDLHRLILEAVAARDPQAARTAMQDHLLQTEQDFETFLGPEIAGPTKG